jgi:conjugal transfer/type IV secretion protein DotA/TraY
MQPKVFLHKIKAQLLLLFTLTLFPALAFASGPSTSLSAMKPASEDMMLQMLGEVIGPVVKTISGVSPAGANGWQAGLTGILTWINGIVLLVGGLIATYVIFSGVLKTAHEGELLGSQWSETFVPLKVAMGAGLLLPFPGLGGFSAIQGIVIWLIMSSVGIADAAWTYVVPTIATTSIGAMDMNRGVVRNIAKTVLVSQVCEQSVNEDLGNLNPGLGSLISRSGPTTEVLTSAGATILAAVTTNASLNHPSGIITYEDYVWGTPYASDIQQLAPIIPMSGMTNVCGQVSWEASDAGSSIPAQIRNAVYGSNSTSIAAMITALKPLATDINTGVQPSSVVWNNAITTYETTQENAAATATNTAFAPAIAKYVAASKKYGFATMGEWYWKLDQWQSAANQAVNSGVGYTAPSLGSDLGSVFSTHYGHEMSAVNQFVSSAHSTQLDTSGQPSTSSEGGGGFWSDVAKIWSSGMVDAVQGIFNVPTGENPLQKISHIGLIMETSGMAIIGEGAITVAGGKGVSGSILKYVGADAGSSLLIMAGKFAMFMGEVLFLVGFTLNFFVPLIPFVIWTITLFTTLVLFIEFVAAAPMWGVMHMHPEGHEVVGRASAGYLIALGIVFRPLLMLIGFLAGSALMYAAAWILNATLGNAILSAMTAGGGVVGPFDMLGEALLYCFLLIAFTWKSFELIYVLPDRYMRWAAAQGNDMGEAGIQQRTDAMAGKGHSSTGSALGRSQQPPEGGGVGGGNKGQS